MEVSTATGARSSPRASCQPRRGYVLSRSANGRSWRKSWRSNCGPTRTDQNIIMAASMPSTGRKPELPEVCVITTVALRTNPARLIQMRKVKAWPALMRFFQRSATAGGPVGRHANGGRLLLGFFRAACQLPERTAASFSASFWEAWTEARSEEHTSELQSLRHL